MYQVCKMDNEERFAVVLVGEDEPVEMFDTEDEAKAYCDQMNKKQDDEQPAEESELMDKSWLSQKFDDLGHRLTRLLKPDAADNPVTSFKVFGNNWFGTWSNNFEDRDKEWFSAKAIDSYVARVDAGIVPLPELRVWHTRGSRIGAAQMVGTIKADNGGVTVWAVGEFDKTPRGQKARAYYDDKKGLGMSQGFTYPDGALRDGVYHAFNTFEVSVLPIAVAANPYTSFQTIKESSMNDDKLKHLKAVFGEDEAAAIIESVQQKTAAQAELSGFKDFLALGDESADMPDVTAAADNAEANMKSLTADLVGDVTELTTGQLALVKIGKAHAEAIKALTDELAQVKKELALAPRRVDESDENTVDDKDLTQSAKDKEAEQSFIEQIFANLD